MLTLQLFKHGFDGYMTHAYPADELRPLTCGPLLRDTDVDNVGVNDIHANASITLVDTLSALPTLYPEAFPGAVRRVAEEVSFDQDVKVQVSLQHCFLCEVAAFAWLAAASRSSLTATWPKANSRYSR